MKTRTQKTTKLDRLTLRLLNHLQASIDTADLLASMEGDSFTLYTIRQQAQRLGIVRDLLESAVPLSVLDTFLAQH